MSYSTCESETVVADLGLRMEALPLMIILDNLFRREVMCLCFDIQSTLRNLQTCKHQALRHVSRTYRVD